LASRAGKLSFDLFELFAQVVDYAINRLALQERSEGSADLAPINRVVPRYILPEFVIVENVGNLVEPYLTPDRLVTHATEGRSKYKDSQSKAAHVAVPTPCLPCAPYR
jgi:hypothetical protein